MHFPVGQLKGTVRGQMMALPGESVDTLWKPITEIKPDDVEVTQVCDLLCEKRCADAENQKECLKICGDNCNGEDIVKPRDLRTALGPHSNRSRTAVGPYHRARYGPDRGSTL